MQHDKYASHFNHQVYTMQFLCSIIKYFIRVRNVQRYQELFTFTRDEYVIPQITAVPWQTEEKKEKRKEKEEKRKKINLHCTR